MDYILIVIDDDGDVQRIPCATLADVTNWIYNRMDAMFYTHGHRKVMFSVINTTKSEEGDEGKEDRRTDREASSPD